MAIKYGKKKSKQNNIIYTIITAMLLCAVFLGMVVALYNKAENEAYENLHVQTKQIKDNLVLQLNSDNENLVTMANFAAKLNAGGMSYDIMFDSFKPIGLFSRIGILTPNCNFITKDEVVDLKGIISFEEEALLGEHITGRTYSYSRPDEEVIRSAVPIRVNGETVGIIYGIIKIDELTDRYKQMVADLDAQLFVYKKDSGDILIDTIQNEYENISFLKDRTYNDGSSYEEFISTDKGFVSFLSAYRKENLHLHYSTIDEFGWMIAFGRYDSQVFSSTHTMARVLIFVFLVMIGIIALYIFILMASKRRLSAITECASNVRKELLETKDGQNNIQDALIEICTFAKSRSAVFFDTDGEFYHYIAPRYQEIMLSPKERQYFSTELFRYASEYYNKTNNNAVNIMCIKSDKHMLNTNPSFCKFLQEHGIKEVSLSATINKANHITILAAINPKRSKDVRALAEKVSACFSMALYNKNYLNKTILAATTDALTGALNRVAYKSDIIKFDEEKPLSFSCIYIDVNELHAINNKYGHSAGDEMLCYVANTLKEVFYGHKVYRMGGDEFLVFCQNVEQDDVKKNIEIFKQQLVPRNYHVAIGLSYWNQNTETEDMVKEAEVRMYEAKAEYYQSKEQSNVYLTKDKEYVQVKTGILEIDTMLSVLKEKYNGIYRVSLSNDKAKHILMPAYLNYNEDEEHFSKLFSKYISESVVTDYHRAVLNFMNYEALKRQLMDGNIPKISFKKNDGELVSLSVYKLCDGDDLVSDTLWVFAKK